MSKSTREKLLESAAALFAQKGYHQTVISEICSAAETNIASVNYHFSSKEALYQEAFEHARKIADDIHPVLMPELAAKERLWRLILGMVRRVQDRGPGGYFNRMVALELANPSEAVGDKVQTLMFPLRNYLFETLSEILPRGTPFNKIKFTAYSVISQCQFFIYIEKGRDKYFEPQWQDENPDEVAEHIYTMVMCILENNYAE